MTKRLAGHLPSDSPRYTLSRSGHPAHAAPLSRTARMVRRAGLAMGTGALVTAGVATALVTGGSQAIRPGVGGEKDAAGGGPNVNRVPALGLGTGQAGSSILAVTPVKAAAVLDVETAFPLTDSIHNGSSDAGGSPVASQGAPSPSPGSAGSTTMPTSTTSSDVPATPTGPPPAPEAIPLAITSEPSSVATSVSGANATATGPGGTAVASTQSTGPGVTDGSQATAETTDGGAASSAATDSTTAYSIAAASSSVSVTSGSSDTLTASSGVGGTGFGYDSNGNWVVTLGGTTVSG
jgi:hypothetical protein